jgi:hypothetical protein
VHVRLSISVLALAAVRCTSLRTDGPQIAPSATAIQPEPAALVAKDAPPVDAALAESAHAAAPYDLAADIEQRIGEARADFGARAPVAPVEQVFVIATPGSGLGGPLHTATVVTEAFFHDRFSKRPAKAISVYVFASAAPYQAYCRRHLGAACVSPFGFYLPTERRIVLDAGPGIGTLVHELVHPIQQDDFPEAPDWLGEGIASLYECFALPKKGEIRGVTNWRLPRLRRALGSPVEKGDARIEKLFGLPDGEFRGPKEDLYYALARYLCQWLDQKGQLWPFYRAWRDRSADDPSGDTAFATVTGKTPREANDDFARWLRAL